MIENLIEDLANSLGQWAYLLVAMLAMAETAAFLGFIAPGEFAVIFGGVLAGEGELNIWILIGIVWASVLAGDTIGFTLGRRLGRSFAVNHGHRVRLTEARLRKVEDYFRRHGGKTILAGRWLGFVRPLMPFTAGTSGMSYRRFLPYDVLGGGLWTVTFCLLGFVFWRSFTEITAIAGRGALAFAVTLIVFVGGYQAIKRLRHPEQRRRFAAWLERQGRRPALRPMAVVLQKLWAVALGPLWRTVLAPVWRVAAPPVRFLFERLTPGGLGIELTTLLAITAVSVYLVSLQINLIDMQTIVSGDGWALDRARELEAGALTAAAKVVSFFGKLGVALVAVALSAIALIGRRRRLEALVLGAGFITAEAAALIIKAAVERPRPSDGLVGADGWSYPSGHATIAVTYLAIGVLAARITSSLRWRLALVIGGAVLAILIGLTRVYLRVHYLSDVGGGWAVGLAAFSIAGITALIATYLRHNLGTSKATRAPSRGPASG